MTHERDSVPPHDTGHGFITDLTKVSFSFPSPPRVNAFTTFYAEFLDETTPNFVGDSGVQRFSFGCPYVYFPFTLPTKIASSLQSSRRRPFPMLTMGT